MPGRLGESAEIDMFLDSRWIPAIVSRRAKKEREGRQKDTAHY